MHIIKNVSFVFLKKRLQIQSIQVIWSLFKKVVTIAVREVTLNFHVSIEHGFRLVDFKEYNASHSNSWHDLVAFKRAKLGNSGKIIWRIIWAKLKFISKIVGHSNIIKTSFTWCSTWEMSVHVCSMQLIYF